MIAPVLQPETHLRSPFSERARSSSIESPNGRASTIFELAAVRSSPRCLVVDSP